MNHTQEQKQREYAKLLVKMGARVQAGDTLFVQAPVEAAPLVRLCAEEAYALGAREVEVQFFDDTLSRLKYLHASPEVFDTVPAWQAARYEQMRQNRTTKLVLVGDDPEQLRGVDTDRIQRWSRATGRAFEAYDKDMTANRFIWCIGAYATAAWATKVFPDVPEAQAVSRLWEQIFATARVTGDGQAMERWEAHIARLEQRTRWLNEQAFTELHFENAQGTDLTVRLPQGHYWAGGADYTPDGKRFLANVPTEEVFTLPDRNGVNGTAVASKPLVLDGQIVDRFRLVFRDGRIVEAHAEQGEEVLNKAIATDEGSAYLGEVALVPTASPISESGILFYETLFDENAACHLAFGDAYPCIRDAEHKSEEELKALGMNRSYRHEDFMIGTPDLSITGKKADGTEVAVFRNGNFVI